MKLSIRGCGYNYIEGVPYAQRWFVANKKLTMVQLYLIRMFRLWSGQEFSFSFRVDQESARMYHFRHFNDFCKIVTLIFMWLNLLNYSKITNLFFNKFIETPLNMPFLRIIYFWHLYCFQTVIHKSKRSMIYVRTHNNCCFDPQIMYRSKNYLQSTAKFKFTIKHLSYCVILVVSQKQFPKNIGILEVKGTKSSWMQAIQFFN